LYHVRVYKLSVTRNLSVLFVVSCFTAAVILLGINAARRARILHVLYDTPAPPATGSPPIASPLRARPGSPYFVDGSGKAVYLTGSHTWTNLQDRGSTDPPPAFDYPRYLDWMVGLGHNFVRLWAWEQQRWAPWEVGDYYFTPLPYQRTGPGTGADGFARADLTRFDQAYFDRLRQRVVAADERGLYVAVMLFEGWSIGPKLGGGNPWPGHPFHRDNNVNGVDGDPDGDGSGWETHSMAVPEARSYQEAYVKKVVDTLNDLDNVLYEISNESGRESVDWQNHMVRFIKNYQTTKRKQHPVGVTAPWPEGRNDDLFAGPADWISPNNSDGADYINRPPPADGRKVIVVDTDHLWGMGGDADWVWKCFTRGLNPIFMDQLPPDGGDWQGVWMDAPRAAMGITNRYARKMDLAAVRPRGDLASTGYALASPGSEYLVYAPDGGSLAVDLSGARGTFGGEWIEVSSGVTHPVTGVRGGGSRSLTPPVAGSIALYLRAGDSPWSRLVAPVALARPAGPTRRRGRGCRRRRRTAAPRSRRRRPRRRSRPPRCGRRAGGSPACRSRCSRRRR
jgi:hypothetical protein